MRTLLRDDADLDDPGGSGVVDRVDDPSVREGAVAWGAAAAARSAVALSSSGVASPPAGTPIDGTGVLLRAIRPDRLSLSVFYDPGTLQSAEEGGNQLIFLSFNDVPGEIFAAEAAATSWSIDASKNDGSAMSAEPFTASGVDVSHLEELLGEEVNGAAGSLILAVQPPGAYNRLVFFTESLGTFATGYLLPTTP